MAKMLAEEAELASCLASSDSDDAEGSPSRPRPWPLRAEKLTAGLFAAGVLLCGAGALARERSRPGTPALDAWNSSKGLFLEYQQSRDGCTDYFSVGQDCSKKNLWECVGDDGSQAYKCCCHHGFGDFSQGKGHTTGLISLADHPTKCVDLTMPYVGSGTPFKEGSAMLGTCNWGNPNKQFHLPTSGTGHIRWASHPKYCLGVLNGAFNQGAMLQPMRCETAQQPWITFGVRKQDKGVQIHTSNNWNMCVDVAGDTDGVPIQLAPCVQHKTSQLFKVITPPKPPPYANTPSLFCISLMMPTGYEKGMLQDQQEKKVGIFQCNDYAVYSNESITLSSALKTDVMKGSLAVEFGGQWHSALNTDVFIRFWDKVVKDPRTWKNEWIVKIDPDAVYFPSRLQEVLRSRWYAGNPKAPVYLNNCHRGMHGPIEVVSQQGLKVYKDRWQECKDGEPYKHKQEDFYFRRCWALLNISKVNVYNLLFENLYACDERSDTKDGRHPCFSRQVSFHPFKTSESYFQCYRRGASMHWVSPMVINDEEPSSANYHHA